jgi:hypothetical protein
MVDHVLDLKRQPFILAGRTVSTIQLQVLGCIKDHIRIGVRDAEVRSDGSVIINLAPDQAKALGNELLALARKGRLNGQ